VSATTAAKGLGGLIDRVREERAEYVIERGGTPVVRLVPVRATSCTLAALSALLKRKVALDPTYLDEVEAGVRAANEPAVPGDPWTS
jgi:prevent-host-death family protein